MPDIKTLSASMINKIAAGEVIERPASVVKELIENAVDAGSKRIELAIERSGSDLIKVVDDGCGIERDQLVLALSPHATSKIADADDLFRISTLGFRGEALASVAEVSQLILRSRTEQAEEGAEIRSDGGTLSPIVPIGSPRGTSIEIRNLFFNIPVRRKFLKSPTTEYGHISEAFNRIAIPNPGIHFVFKHNGRVIHDLPPATEARERIGRLFGSEIGERLIYVENTRGEVEIRGYVGHPDCSRPNSSLQYIFLNGRCIRDRSLQHALSEAYRGLLSIGRFPVAFINITVPPNFVDVNVHPTKMEVRFVNPSVIYSGFLGAIREEFLRSDLKSRPAIPTDPNPSHESTEQDSFDPRAALDDSAAQDMRSQILNWANSDMAQAMTSADAVKIADVEFPAGSPQEKADEYDAPFEQHFANPQSQAVQQSFPWESDEPHKRDDSPLSLHTIAQLPASTGPAPSSFEDIFESQRRAAQFEKTRAARTDEPDSDNSGELESAYPERLNLPQTPPAPRKPVLQIHRRYLVTEISDGLAVIDQHALHERVLYEKIRAKMESGKMDSQKLLVPVPVDLVPTELACVLDNRALLADFGLLVDTFGGNTVLVSGYPVIIRDVPPADILMLLLKPLMESGRKPEKTDLLDEMMHQMACKAAVKAGDFLGEGEMVALLELAEAEIHSHHCPHGRPSTLVFSCQELDKMFKRT